jgi:16S rRNA (adenine1518-N6/adenine1519-N6)-dimethyltransferase
LQSRPTAELIIDDVLAGKHTINPRVHEALQRMAGSESSSFKLVANLPYNVASPLIANLLLAPYQAARGRSQIPEFWRRGDRREFQRL